MGEGAVVKRDKEETVARSSGVIRGLSYICQEWPFVFKESTFFFVYIQCSYRAVFFLKLLIYLLFGKL